jgi:hypothetical protein
VDLGSRDSAIRRTSLAQRKASQLPADRGDTGARRGDAWVLRKDDKTARCSLVTHQFGWELRLMTTDLIRSQVCRSSEEILSTHEAWKGAMMEKGWG